MTTTAPTAADDIAQPNILAQIESHPLVWGKFFAPHHFSRLKTPAFHMEIAELCAKAQRAGIVAPRGFAKTTIAMFLNGAWSIATRKAAFIVLVGNTFAKAAGQLEIIAEEFRTNEELKKTYGITLEKDAEGHAIFEHRDGMKVCVMCFGHEQIPKMRGIRFGTYRPQLIVIDDLEDDELVRSPERRNKLKEDFDSALLPCVDIDYKIIMIGTILHDDALIADVVTKGMYHGFKTLYYQALVEEGTKNERSLWPERYSVTDLKEMRKHKPLQFAKEYQNDPISGGVEFFSKDDFVYWREENGKACLYDQTGAMTASYDFTSLKAAVACDLAWEEKRSADFTVLFPGYLTPKNDILLDTYVCERGMRPDAFEEYLYTMVERLQSKTQYTVPVGFEKAKLEKVMKHLLKQSMKRGRDPLIFKDIPWGADKVERMVTRLQPYYKQKMIYHRVGMGEYESQLLRIPSGKHDDLPDGAQGLVMLLKIARSQKMQAGVSDTFDILRKHAMPRIIDKEDIPRVGRFMLSRKKKGSFIPYKETFL